MENRVAVISMIVGKNGNVEALNALLHEYGEYIIGRMGIPYRKLGINIIITDDDHFILNTKKSGYELYKIPE